MNGGRANSVVFDGSKEDFVIMHRSRPKGSPFKMLGVMYDPKLRMHVVIDKLATDAVAIDNIVEESPFPLSTRSRSITQSAGFEPH